MEKYLNSQCTLCAHLHTHKLTQAAPEHTHLQFYWHAQKPANLETRHSVSGLYLKSSSGFSTSSGGKRLKLGTDWRPAETSKDWTNNRHLSTDFHRHMQQHGLKDWVHPEAAHWATGEVRVQAYTGYCVMLFLCQNRKEHPTKTNQSD